MPRPSASTAARDGLAGRIPTIRGSLLWLLVLLVVGGFLAFQVGRQVYANWAINQEADRIRAEIERVLVENEAARLRLEYYRSDAFVSQAARRYFNLGADGERVLIIPPGATAPPPPAAESEMPPAPPLLEQWLGLFFGS
jgi:hypothetical protein